MKNIIVTGASSGIGFETVLKLSENKENTIFAIARNEKKLVELQKKCFEASGNKVNVIPADLTLLLSGSTELLDVISSKVEHIDILINNAGKLENAPFEEISPQIAQAIFNVNYFAPAELIKRLMPLILKSEKAHVVNISSMGGFHGASKFPGLTHYSASKAAISSLTECLAEEYKESNISFNSLALGAVQTDMLEKAFPGYIAPVSASEMASFISNFAVNSHHFFNGRVLPVSLSRP